MKLGVKKTWSVPGKCFLLGEYVALKGGPSLVMAMAPEFELQMELSSEPRAEGINPSSPAGRFIRENKNFFAQHFVRFVDPYDGRGGLGASAAQFALAYAALDEQNQKGQQGINLQKAWNQYRQYSQLDLGESPSGADLVGQVAGGISEFRRDDFSLKQREWPFSDVAMMLIRTGEKVATHTHLRDTKLGDLSKLSQLSEAGSRLLAQGDREFFVTTKEFQRELERLSLMTSRSRDLVSEWEALPGVIAARGCGAMGADFVLVYLKADAKNLLLQHAQSLGLEARPVEPSREGLRLNQSSVV